LSANFTAPWRWIINLQAGPYAYVFWGRSWWEMRLRACSGCFPLYYSHSLIGNTQEQRMASSSLFHLWSPQFMQFCFWRVTCHWGAKERQGQICEQRKMSRRKRIGQPRDEDQRQGGRTFRKEGRSVIECNCACRYSPYLPYRILQTKLKYCVQLNGQHFWSQHSMSPWNRWPSSCSISSVSTFTIIIEDVNK